MPVGGNSFSTPDWDELQSIPAEISDFVDGGGVVDVAKQVAQTAKTGTNTAGDVSTYIDGQQGTGTGAGSSIVLRTAPAGGSGSSANALTARVTIDANGNLTMPGGIEAGDSYFTEDLEVAGAISGASASITGNVHADKVALGGAVSFGTNEKLRIRTPIVADDNATASINAAGKGLVIQQTVEADGSSLLELQDETGAVKAKIDDSGLATVAGLSTAGLVTAAKLKGSGSPSVVAESAAGTGRSAAMSANSNDSFGQIELTSGTGTAGGDLVTVTYASAYTTAPFVAFSSSNDNAAFEEDGGVHFYISSLTTTGFKIAANSGVSASTLFKFTYHVGQ